jgi:hypothetical protein
MITVASRTTHIVLTSATLLVTGLTLVFTAPGAGAQPIAAGQGEGGGNAPAAKNGDNGTVKIHRSTTPVTDRRNQPHVCVFYLDGFGFDPAQAVSWQIKSWPPTGDRSVVAGGTLTLDSSGNGHTGDMTLQNGHYKLFWTFTGEHGFAKQKVFWVSCAAPTTPPAQTPTPTLSPTPTVSSPTPTVTPTPTLSPSTAPPSALPSAPAPTPVNTTLPVTG